MQVERVEMDARFLIDKERYRTAGKLRVALPQQGQAALAAARAHLRTEPDSVIVACPCGRSADVALAESDRHGLPYPLKVCALCGLLRMSPQPSDAVIAWFYSTVYRDLYGPHAASSDALFEGKRWKGALVERALERAGVTIANGPVLDLGCGGGWTLHAFAARGYECVGYDLDPRLLQIGQDRGLDLRLGETEHARASGIKANLLISAHVLEHVRDPEAYLRSLVPLLAPGGTLYIEVPHIRRIGARLHGDSLLYWQRAHLWEFQREHVIAYAARAGLTTIWSDEDEDHAYLLCRAAELQPLVESKLPPWPALGATVAQMLLAFERQRSGVANRARSALAFAVSQVAARVPEPIKQRLRGR